MTELANKERTEIFQDFDKRDENQILAEIRGEILEDLVYDITLAGRRVTNLSYAGVKEAIRRRGSLEILEVKTEETEATIRGLVKVRDLQNRIDVLGASEADKTKPFAYTLAINKAERNAFAKLIPAKWLATLVDDFLQQKKAEPKTSQPKEAAQKTPAPKKVGPIKLNPELLTTLTTTTVMQAKGLSQLPLTEGLNAIGMINTIDDVTVIVPEQANLRRDHTAFTNFLFPRVLDQLCNKNNCEYESIGTQNGELLYIIIKGKLTEAQIKEVANAVRWTFGKAASTDQQTQGP